MLITPCGERKYSVGTKTERKEGNEIRQIIYTMIQNVR